MFLHFQRGECDRLVCKYSHIFDGVCWVENQLLGQLAEPKLFFWETKLLQFLADKVDRDSGFTVIDQGRRGKAGGFENSETLSSSYLSTGVHLLALFSTVTIPAGTGNDITQSPRSIFTFDGC